MDFAQLALLIQTVGLPTVLVLWFMIRTEQVINRNTVALEALREIEGRELEALRQVLGKEIDSPVKR